MLKYVTELFKNIYGDKIDDVICDGYIPTDGEYLIVEENENSFEIKDTINIKQDKKTKEIDRSNKYFDFICKADYMSMYLNSNKAMSDKNIYSNNYLSFFCKNENIHNGKINNEVIKKYYSILRNPFTKYKKASSKKIYEEVEKISGKVNEKRLDKIESWILSNIYDLVSKDSKQKTYLKIFFKYDISEYERESQKYLIPNIYNNTKYNIKVKDITLGLSDNNMAMNAHKPYLENKSRKIKVPFLLSSEEVLLQKKFFDYLVNMVSIGKVNLYINEKEIKALSNKEVLNDNFNGIYMRIKKGEKEKVEILDFDTVEDYECKKKKPLKLRNVLKVDNEKLKFEIPYGNSIHEMSNIKDILNNVFFSKFLDGNYFTEAKDLKINNANLKRNLLLCRSALFTWFYKGNSVAVWKVLNTSSLSLIKGSITNGYLTEASEQFNLRCAFTEYFEGGEEMADILKEVKDSLKKKINQSNTDYIESDKEYYFAVGQVTGYFISLSKSKNKKHSLANSIINARNNKRIKEELEKLYRKYNYDIDYERIRFKNLYGMVKSYEPETEVNHDLIIAGYLHSNLIFEKLEKQDEDKEENKK